MDDENDRKADDPDEEEIQKLCQEIRKSWSKNQKKSRLICKTKEYTVNIINVTDLDIYN